jgi:hypothetical protein
MRSSLSISAVFLVFVGCQFQASCGGKNLNMEKANEFVATNLEKETGLKPAVTCPEKVKIKTGDTFVCTAKFPAAEATVTISQDDDKGNVTIKSINGILIVSKLEAQIADQVGKQVGAQVTAECGEGVQPAVAGSKIMCEVKDANGGGAKVETLVKDTAGNVSFRVIPNAPAPTDPATPPTPAPTDPATPPAPAPTEPAPTPTEPAPATP